MRIYRPGYMFWSWLIILLAAGTKASAGDRDYEFQKCISQAKCYECEDLRIWLKLTFWTCLDNCKYNCMMSISNDRQTQGLSILQYSL